MCKLRYQLGLSVVFCWANLIYAQIMPFKVDIFYMNQKTLIFKIHNESDYDIKIPVSIKEGDMQSALYLNIVRNYRDTLNMKFYDLLTENNNNRKFIDISSHQSYIKQLPTDNSIISWSYKDGTSVMSEHICYLKAKLYLKYFLKSPTPVHGSFWKDFDIKPLVQDRNRLFGVRVIYKPEVNEVIILKSNWTGDTIQEYEGIISAEIKDSCLLLSYKNSKKGEYFIPLHNDSTLMSHVKLSDVLIHRTNECIRKIVLFYSSFYKENGNLEWKLYKDKYTLVIPHQDKIDFFMNRKDSTGMYSLWKEVIKRTSLPLAKDIEYCLLVDEKQIPEDIKQYMKMDIERLGGIYNLSEEEAMKGYYDCSSIKDPHYYQNELNAYKKEMEYCPDNYISSDYAMERKYKIWKYELLLNKSLELWEEKK